MSKEIIAVHHLVKKYSSQVVLNNISLQIREGEFIAIMGPSGSGKTTLLNCLSTLDEFDQGEVIFEENNLARMNRTQKRKIRQEKISFVFQEYNLLDNYTVKENIYLPLTIQSSIPASADEYFEILIRQLKIEDLLDKFPSQLSGGQKQRVACARSFLLQPKVIFADEPTGALDTRNAARLLEIFQEQHSRNETSILMVTHDSRVASYASRVIFLVDGKIVNEFYRGDLTQKKFYDEIARVQLLLGGLEG